MTTQDLANYSVIMRETVNISELTVLRGLDGADQFSRPSAYRGARIFSTVAPSSGAVVLSALKVRRARRLPPPKLTSSSQIFEGFRGNYTETDPEINITTARLLEATQFAYGQRSELVTLST